MSIVANVLQSILVVITLAALWKNRKHLPGLVNWLRRAYLSERARKLVATLDSIDGLDYREKEHRGEINALLGRLHGQVHGLPQAEQAVQALLAEITQWDQNSNGRSEGRKRKLVSLGHVAVETCKMQSDLTIGGTSTDEH